MFNDKFNVYRSEWLDLVFANRNHEYGAYDLRKNYSRTLNKALLTASVFFISAVCLPVVYKHLHAGDPASTPALINDNDQVVTLDMSQIKQQPPQALPEIDPVKIKTTRYVTPRVVEASRAKEEVPEMKVLESGTISTKTQEGIEVASNVSPAATSTSTGNGTAMTDGDGGREVIDAGLVEKFPEFPGGMEAFAKYLRKNLRYPASAAESGITGRVFLSFIVERDGSLTDIKVIKGIGFGCDEEAMRVLRKSPAWTPGIQNKQKVRVQYTLPLLFQME